MLPFTTDCIFIQPVSLVAARAVMDVTVNDILHTFIQPFSLVAPRDVVLFGRDFYSSLVLVAHRADERWLFALLILMELMTITV